MDMIKSLLDGISDIKSIKKVFMKKRDIMTYDNSWQTITQQETEYDVDIIADIIAPIEWHRILEVEREFGKQYPNFRVKYNLIEFDSNIPLNSDDPNAKLVYDADTLY